jgi:glycosyltransferase involved in cell wall biosynthesis
VPRDVEVWLVLEAEVGMRIAMMGSRGVPARYGGSETAIEEVGRRLVERGHQVVVYCRRHNNSATLRWHLGMERVVLPSAHTKNLDTPSHTLLSMMHALAFRKADLLHFHGVGNALFLPALRPLPTATVVTVDGPDWERPKWGGLARWSLRFSARLAVALADALIIDNRPSQRYFAEHFGTEGHYIPYGAYLVDEPEADALESFGLHDRGYVLFVGRLIPDKGVHLLVEAFEGVQTDLQLAIVGDNPYFPDYIRRLKSTRDPRIRFLGYQFGAPYRQLCSHAYLYVHPLLVDGTSPALLQSMGFGNCILTSDLPEAMDVVGDTGFSFRTNDVNHLRLALQELIDRPDMVEEGRRRARERVGRLYNWDLVTDQHEELYRTLLAAPHAQGLRQEREAAS